MQDYSVSDVAEMLGVNAETVRRWIRDDRLKAKRGLGRGGNSLQLEDIVEFVNTPPCNYVLPLMAWLDSHGIPYQKETVSYTHSDSPLDHLPTGAATSGAAVTASGVGLGLASGAAGVIGAILPVAAPLVGAAALMTASKKKTHEYSDRIRLLPQAADEKVEDNAAETEQAELPALETTSPTPETKSESFDKSIRAKIIEEQIKLVKLKQELARVTAEISVAENQIEYYNLMLQSSEEPQSDISKSQRSKG